MAVRVSGPVQRDSAPTPPISVEITGIRFRRFPNKSQWLYVAETTQRLAPATWGCDPKTPIWYRTGFRITVPMTGRGTMVEAGLLASTPPCRTLITTAYTAEMRALADSARSALRSVLSVATDSIPARFRTPASSVP
ncbi:MAG: hypothetical protein C0497_07345 [Gemmatimonas sp.]|nr:hypothetical protein [Gemmatimonas sp.]